MDKSRPYKKRAARLFQKLRSNKNRFSGILLIMLGVMLGIAARGTGGSPFQDFTSGILLGLSAGSLLVGILAAARFFSAESFSRD